MVKQKTENTFQPTAEQLAIYEAVAKGDNVIVRALAGTGKTTTLVTLAERLEVENPGTHILYLAFNKSVQLEAERKFPNNVECRTADSVAWNHPSCAPLVNRSELKTKKRVSEDLIIKGLNVPEITGASGKKKWKIMGAKRVLGLAKQTVNNFCISDDDEISEVHLARLDEKAQKNASRINGPVLDLAIRLWQDILAPNGIFPPTNTHVTKYWALQRPNLSSNDAGLKHPADVIFFDEAQDVNAVLGRVVADQTAQKVIVGDGNQSIYAWRGAVDYLDKISTDSDLSLTTSFRFGPEIAEASNKYLGLLGSRYEITGAGPSGFVRWGEKVESVEPDAVIARTNVGAIKAIMDQLENGRSVKIQKRYSDELQMLISSALWLMGGAEWKKRPTRVHPDLADFKSWDEVKQAADSGDSHDAKTRMLFRMVEEHGIKTLAEVLKKTITSDSGSWDVEVLTAHSAKGLEWDHVLIFNDFWMPKYRSNRGESVLAAEEVRLAYVSVTRAKKLLSVGRGGLDWVRKAQDESLLADCVQNA